MAKTPMISSRKGAGASSMRPCDRTAASSEPAATPMAKTSLIAVSTSTPPPMRDLMMTGTSDSVIAPTIQNQLTAAAPTHWRSSALSSLRIFASPSRGCS